MNKYLIKPMKLLIFLFTVLCFSNLNLLEVKAATAYKKINVTRDNVKVGEVTFSSTWSESDGWSIYMQKGADKYLLDSGKGLSGILLTNGSDVYYEMSTQDHSLCTVYKKKIGSSYRKKVFSVNTYTFELCGYRNNKLYYIRELDPGKFCSYDLKTKKIKTLMNNVTVASQYGKYFITTPYTGDIGAIELKSYNTSSGKIKTISKKTIAYSVISKRIYYVNLLSAESKLYSGNAYKIDVVRCDLNGKNRKTLLSKKTIKGYIVAIGKNYIKYADKNGKIHTIRYK